MKLSPTEIFKGKKIFFIEGIWVISKFVNRVFEVIFLLTNKLIDVG
jgi:hypothetical protein